MIRMSRKDEIPEVCLLRTEERASMAEPSEPKVKAVRNEGDQRPTHSGVFGQDTPAGYYIKGNGKSWRDHGVLGGRSGWMSECQP